MSDLAITTIRTMPLDHPEPVQHALEVLDACEASTVAKPKLMLKTVSQVDKTIQELATYYATKKAATEAKSEVRGVLQIDVINAVADCFEEYVAQLEPVFDEAVHAYAENIDRLPTHEFTAAELAEFTPDQFEAYAVVKDAVAQIKSVLSVLKGLSRVVPGQSLANVVDPDHLVLHAADVRDFVFVQTIRGHENTADAVYLATAPKLRKALANGIQLQLSTPAEAGERYARLEAQRQAMPDTEYRLACSSLVR